MKKQSILVFCTLCTLQLLSMRCYAADALAHVSQTVHVIPMTKVLAAKQSVKQSATQQSAVIESSALRATPVTVVAPIGHGSFQGADSSADNSWSPTSTAKDQAKGSVLRWQAISVGKALPKDALIAGYNDKGPIYICNAQQNGGLHPGQYTKKGCLLSYGGKTFYHAHFNILRGSLHHIAWHSKRDYQQNSYRANADWGYRPLGLKKNALMTPEPVVGGDEQPSANEGYYRRSFQQKTLLYICRCILDNRIHVGKIVSRACNVSWHKGEYMVDNFQVLFYHPQVVKSPVLSPSVIMPQSS